MKIGVLTTSYPQSEADPAGHFVRGLARWLQRNVGDVEVLALEADPDPGRRMAEGGLPALIEGNLALAARLSLQLLAATARRAHRWDAVVSHWLAPCAAVAALIRPRYHLAIAHGSDVELLRRIPGGAHLVRRLSRRADLVYVAEALRIPGAKGRVVAMPAEHVALPVSEEERSQARATLGLRDERVALYLGRLAPEKGVRSLLAALPEHLHLLVAGDGPERAALQRAALQRAAAARVTFLGARFGAEKRALLAAADLLVVPSQRDGAPTVIAEARQLGVPILATNVGGLPAAVGVGGTCVPVEHFAAALSRWSPPPRVSSATATWEDVGPTLWRGPSRTASKTGCQNPSRLDVYRYASLR